MSHKPDTPVAIDTAALTDLIRSIAARPPKADVRVTELRRQPATYYSSFSMEELDARLSDGRRLALVLKDLGPRGLLRDARRVKPRFLYDPMREIETYRQILEPYRVGAPAYFGCHVDEERQHYLLLVERAEGRPLWQEGDLSAWCEAARWLADMHVRLAVPAESLCTPARLIRYDEAYFCRWAERTANNARGAPAVGKLIALYPRLIERLASSPCTFIHGEFHASNVIVESSALGLRVRPVDWEMAAIGPGLMDLADLTAGKWTEQQRGAIVDAYRSATQEAGGRLSDTFDEDLDYCRLHRAVQWLGWADEWAPPREHAQDWLAEALRLADHLGASQ